MKFTRPGQSLPAAAGGDRGGQSVIRIGLISEFQLSVFQSFSVSLVTCHFAYMPVEELRINGPRSLLHEEQFYRQSRL